MDQPHSTRQPKYLKFRTLYAKCFVLSLPVAAYGALIGSMLYLYANDTYKLFCLPLGLLVALFAYPLLFSNMRRRALVLVDVYFMALMMVALIVMQNQEFFYIAIGVGVGCGWAAVQGYVREVAGWEDRRASHINNLPNIMYVLVHNQKKKGSLWDSALHFSSTMWCHPPSTSSCLGWHSHSAQSGGCCSSPSTMVRRLSTT